MDSNFPIGPECLVSVDNSLSLCRLSIPTCLYLFGLLMHQSIQCLSLNV